MQNGVHKRKLVTGFQGSNHEEINHSIKISPVTLSLTSVRDNRAMLLEACYFGF